VPPVAQRGVAVLVFHLNVEVVPLPVEKGKEGGREGGREGCDEGHKLTHLIMIYLNLSIPHKERYVEGTKPRMRNRERGKREGRRGACVHSVIIWVVVGEELGQSHARCPLVQ